ncbi:MAG: manganese efflux pump [Candidatus Riflebacteria bacterium]|nr:manganese efflux pump [Candidatus Riflebacteria bacterium]
MILNSLVMILGIAFALGCDAFAVGLALGTRGLDFRASFRLWFHFGLFQFLMPIIGWSLGSSILKYIEKFDHWIAFALLAGVSIKMFKESLSSEDEEETTIDPTRGWSLVMLSLATSIDALGIGFSMGVAKSNLLFPSFCIGIVAGIMTFIGIKLGGKLNTKFGKRVEMVGAVILFIIALKLLEI